MTSRMALVSRLAKLAISANYQLATAESCTGGGVAKALTEIAGSSAWFTAGLVTYSNQAKQNLLGVTEAMLEKQGAVSKAVVKAMVKGACERAQADLAVALSGVAGPGGGSPEKPVGTVWLAWGTKEKQLAKVFNFTGNRRQIREASIDKALEGLADWLEKSV